MSTVELQSFEPSHRIKSVCENASAVEIDHTIPAKRYFRSTVEMERMARVYVEEGQLEKALILYLRLISILVEKLPKHPLYTQIAPQDISARKKKLVSSIFPTAEKLKSRLKQQYGEEYKRMQKEKEAAAVAAAEQAAQEEQQRRQQEVERQQQEKQQREAANAKSDGHRIPLSVAATAPTAVLGAPLQTKNIVLSDYDAPAAILPSPAAVVPVLPSPAAVVPVLPSPAVVVPSSATVAPIPAPRNLDQSSIPQINRSIKPDHLLGKQDTLVAGLQNLHYPRSILAKFLELASRNTNRNVETCGVLCGKLSRNQFVISHLVLLKQSGTADSCTTVEEEELFDVQDKHDLITLGWIHTHPSQTSFLSSVDLHTHFSYQQLLPEAIAIVCAPKYQQIGVYSLTADGIKTMASCRERGFHFHSKNPPLFKDSEHVIVEDGLPLAVVDLR